MTQPDPSPYHFYLVLDPDHVTGDVMQTAVDALDNGVTCAQLRWKTATDGQIIEMARAVLALSRPRGIPLIINDRLDIALVVGADGVHLGVDDIPVEDARRVGGPDFLIGFSPETDGQIAGAEMAGASYLGIGPIFGTVTKLDAGPALGIEEFSRRQKRTDLPVVAIGGITADNAIDAMAAGANGVAVASTILGSADPVATTKLLRQAMLAHS